VKGFSQPSFSPDGKLIATLTSRIINGAYQYGVSVFDAASQTKKLTISATGWGRPVWSPTGESIALLASVDSGKYATTTARLWIINVRNGKTVYANLGPVQGTEVCFNYPTWLLGGESVLATIPFSPGVWIVDLEGNVETLAEPRPDQGMSRPQGLAALPYGGPCDSAVASTDGRYVVYTAGLGINRGPFVTDLINKTRFSLEASELCSGRTVITWSPSEPRFLRWGVDLPLEVISAVDGSVQQLASDGSYPAWSPDGRSVAYWRPDAGGNALWLVQLDSLQSTRLIAPNPNHLKLTRAMFGYDLRLHWSPDGRSIAFISAREEHPEVFLLELR
jgi:hypothetical protein